jgi:hypothetical protein
MLTLVPICGNIAERYHTAGETQTEEEYDLVCADMRKRYGPSTIETLHNLPMSLSPHWAVYIKPQGQWLIFFGSTKEFNTANTLLDQRSGRPT